MVGHTPGYYCPYCHGYLDFRYYYPDNQPQVLYQPYMTPMPNWYYPYNRDPETFIGKATWTWGGVPTKCEISWSYDNNMTVAVSDKSPFKCGQKLKVRNLSFLPSKEIIVTVIDEVKKFPPHKINLHRKAFEALGAAPSVGVLNVEITPISM